MLKIKDLMNFNPNGINKSKKISKNEVQVIYASGSLNYNTVNLTITKEGDDTTYTGTMRRFVSAQKIEEYGFRLDQNNFNDNQVSIDGEIYNMHEPQKTERVILYANGKFGERHLSGNIQSSYGGFPKSGLAGNNSVNMDFIGHNFTGTNGWLNLTDNNAKNISYDLYGILPLLAY
ncbi:MAG: hypothetical protein HYU63_02875 [Armatimonadetes bacterium]|nr:hypothetical protein [Armatimonadota bacterium]